MLFRILVLVLLLHVRAVSAQATSSRAATDSATLDKVRVFATRLRALLDSQSVEGLAKLMTPPATAYRAEPSLFRFLGGAQILSSAGSRITGAVSGLSVVPVSPDVWVLTGVDEADRRSTSSDGGRRVWTALVNMRDSMPLLLYLHVSPPA